MSASHAQRVRERLLRHQRLDSNFTMVFRSADGLILPASAPLEPFIHRVLCFPDRDGRRIRSYERMGTEEFAGEELAVYHEMPATPPAYRCSWVTSESGVRPTWCGKKATHRCTGADAYFCSDHAKDYEDCFGDATTKTIQ